MRRAINSSRYILLIVVATSLFWLVLSEKGLPGKSRLPTSKGEADYFVTCSILSLRNVYTRNAPHHNLHLQNSQNKCAAEAQARTMDITMTPPRSPQSARDQSNTPDDEMRKSPSLESLNISASPKLETTKALGPPVASYAAPTPVVKRSDLALDAPDTFHLFPFLPTEIRHKIWKANIRHQVLQVIYDVHYETYRRNSYLHGHQYRAAWRFTTSKISNVANRAICQESRAELAKAGYELLRLSDDPTKVRWFNPEFDTLFLDTNAHLDVPFDNEAYEDYEQEVASVLPPMGEPLCPGGMANIRHLAVNDTLWTTWPFSEDNGSDASCEYCADFNWDDTKDDFKEMIAKMPVLESLQIERSVTLVISEDEMVGVEFTKRGSEDQYGICLHRRLMNWREEKGLNIEAEVV